MSIRVMIADDHKLIRQGLRSLLLAESRLEIVAEAENGRHAIELARLYQPDVVTMDISMPEMDGVEATRILVAEHPGIKVIALSLHSDLMFVQELFRVGAQGYLQKDCEISELVQAIITTYDGQPYLGKTLEGIGIKDILCGEAMCGVTSPAVLTDRETEVLLLMVEELATKVIATRLNIGVKTVETYQKRMKRKLNISNLAGLTKYAIRQRLACVGENLLSA